jgi:hypothetical protein
LKPAIIILGIIAYEREESQRFLKLRGVVIQVLRKIYGPTKEKDGTWRIKSNEELNRLTGNKNIINYTKAQRLAWFGTYIV